MVVLHIDGVVVEPRALAVPEMALSSGRVGMTRHRFKLVVAEGDVLRILEEPYARWVADSAEDDRMCGGAQDELAFAGYPPLSQLLRTADLLGLVVAGYLRGELLRPLTWDGESPISYWLDEVEECVFSGGLLTLHGRCYSKPARLTA